MIQGPGLKDEAMKLYEALLKSVMCRADRFCLGWVWVENFDIGVESRTSRYRKFPRVQFIESIQLSPSIHPA